MIDKKLLIPRLEDIIDEIPAPTKEDDQPQLPQGTDLDAEEPIQGYDGNVDIIIDIDNSRNETDREMFYNERDWVHNKIEYMERVLKVQFKDGQEGFTSFIANSLVSIPNILGHITNLFYTTLRFGFKDFKRSDLTEYSDSSRATMTRIYTMNYYEIKDTVVPTPQGMKGTYRAALDSLKAYFNALDMTSRSKQMYETIDAIATDIKKENGTFHSLVTDYTRSFKNSNIEKCYKDTSKYFTPDKSEGDEFGKLFANMNEFEKVCKDAMDMDSELRAVAGVHDRMKATEEKVEEIIQYKEKLSKEQVNMLVDLVRSYGDLFEGYATCLNDLSRLDHNLMEIVKDLRDIVER